MMTASAEKTQVITDMAMVGLTIALGELERYARP